MGEFQDLKPLDGLEVSSISADLYNNGRDDLALFYFREGANYATLTTQSSIVSETLTWNEKSNKKIIKALLVNTKMRIPLLVNKDLMELMLLLKA